MENKKNKILVFIFYIISFFIIYFSYNKNISLRIILFFIACLFLYFGGYILVNKLGYNKRIYKINLIIYFILYLIIIISLTLFEDVFGRKGLVIASWDKKLLKLYLNTSFNLMPFKTIKLFINGYKFGLISFNAFLINIIGNIVAFIPCSIVVPLLFKKTKYYKFFLFMLSFIIIIELLQFLTLSGSCDIDDVIFNMFGCSLAYFIFKLKIVNKLLRRIFLSE